MRLTDKINALADLLRQARHGVVLSGAGISTLSGIPDFRGPQGLYLRPDIDADRLFDLQAFQQDPSYYYRHAADIFYSSAETQPSVVHRVLANLEEAGLVKAVITQNIDLLHQKAGSRRVLELHGSPSVHHCLTCCTAYDFDSVKERAAAGLVPFCENCGGVVKPDIVFFGEMLPADTLDQADDEANRADFMLVLGSSLTVYPAAALPEIAVRQGAKLAIVNNSPTHLDRYAIWKDSDLNTVFSGLENIFFQPA